MKSYLPTVGLFLAMLLSACGGGGGGGDAPAGGAAPASTPNTSVGGGGGDAPADGAALPSTPNTSVLAVTSAEGAYVGTSDTSRVELLVLENDSYWMTFYTSDAPWGFLQGQGLSNDGNFTSSNTKNFSSGIVSDASLASTYTVASHTIAGTISKNGSAYPFTAGPLDASSLYNYNTPVNIANVSGTWTLLTAVSGSRHWVDIHSDGTLTGIENMGSGQACTYSGTIAPRASGKNVYDLSILMGAAPSCQAAGQTLTGIGILLPINATSQKLSLIYTNAERTIGVFASGTRTAP